MKFLTNTIEAINTFDFGTKVSRSVFLAISMILAALVPITSPVWYNSLSAHADATNEIVYNAMHIFSAVFFILNWGSQKRGFDFVVGLGMISILLTNMYDFQLAHNICTGTTIGLAVFNMLYFSTKPSRIMYIWSAVSMVTIFFVGYLSTDVYFAFAEIIVMWIVGFNMFRRIWIHSRA